MSALTSSPTLTSRYVDVGFVHVSWANLAVLGAMVLLFILVLALPFPGRHARRDGAGR